MMTEKDFLSKDFIADCEHSNKKVFNRNSQATKFALETKMATHTFVRAKVDAGIKQEATKVFADVRLTVSDAFRLLLTRIAKEKTIVFDPLIPNAQTFAAMNDAMEGRVKEFDSVEQMFEYLNAPDSTDRSI